MVAVSYGTLEEGVRMTPESSVSKNRNKLFAAVLISAACLLVLSATLRPKSYELASKPLSSYGMDAMMDPKGTNSAFVDVGDGDGTSSTKLNSKEMFGTNAAFLEQSEPQLKSRKFSNQQLLGTNAAFINKGDGSGQSTKARVQSLWDVPKYEWTADMEGTYLPARPELTGEDTKQINLIGRPFLHKETDETNLGGIPGDGPANILPGY